MPPKPKSPKEISRDMIETVANAINPFPVNAPKKVKMPSDGLAYATQQIHRFLEERDPIALVTSTALDGFAEHYGFEDTDAMLNAAQEKAKAFINKWIQHTLKDSPLARIAQIGAESLITGESIEDITRSAVAGILDQAKSVISTALFSAQRQISRAVAKEITDDGRPKLWYAGPEDLKTRPFCLVLVNWVLYEDELSRTQNGQGLPVLEYCGGWNCRHTLIPVTPDIMKVYDLKIPDPSIYDRATSSGRRG